MNGLKECTTLCYIENDGKYLMMYRSKKKDDENKGKYIGPGGHLEPGETPEECVLREVKEETGLTLTDYKLRGLITFVFENKDELAFLYTSDKFEGTLNEDCNEGRLEWVDKDSLKSVPLWEGDKIFLRLLNERESYFSLKLVYEGDRLVSSELF